MPTFPITIVFEIDAETEEEAHQVLTDMLSPVFPIDALLPEIPRSESEQRERAEDGASADPLLGMSGHQPVPDAKPIRRRRTT